jgi:hypothetical protein
VPRKKHIPPVAPLPARPGFKLGEAKADRLLEILRGLALKNRKEEAQVFHPIREVARHFGVPLSTVARIYNRLEEEGVLVSVRGSRTLLQGLSSGRHLSVRGFIGLPAFTPWFVTLQDYRTFCIRTRRELRARGFAVATVFYDAAEVQQHGRLRRRIEKYDFDTVLWHQPERPAKEIASHLKDSGIRVLGVSDRGFASIRCRYEVRREAAIVPILREWCSQSGIESVVVVRGLEPSAAREELLKKLLDEAGLEHEFKSAGEQRLSAFIDSLGTNKKSGIILPATAAAMFGFRAPEALASLMRRTRVALKDGPVSIPFARVPDVTADLVLVDWQLIAEQVADDLITGKAFDRTATTIFEATPHLRAPLRLYAQSL